MNTLHIGIRVALITLICGLCAPAAAQTDEEIAAGYSLLSTTTTGGILTTVGGVVLTVVLVNNSGKKAMKTYIRDNAVALRSDITRGGGVTVADLGQVFGVPEEQLGSFGRAIRGQREALLSLVGPDPIDDKGTEQFIQAVWQAVASDEGLARAVAAQQG